MLRTIFVLIIIIVGLRYSLKGAFESLLFYLWLAYFRPDQWLWWDFVTPLNLSFIIGALVVIRTAISGQKFSFGIGPALLFAFLAQSLLSTIASPVSWYAWWLWKDFARTILISYMITVLVTDERKLRLTLVVMSLSLGFEGAKQGFAHGILHPGSVDINGLPMLGDNNGVAVGMLMLVPILIALARTAPHWKERYVERFFGVGVLLRALVTFSRGGFLALGAMTIHFIVRTRRKLVTLAAVAVVGTLIFALMPQSFWDRMGTIQTATDNPAAMDASSASRLHFWEVATAMANQRPLVGVGFNSFNVMYDRFDTTAGAYGRGRSVHSAWFGVLGELGYLGLSLFVLQVMYSFAVCWRAWRMSKHDPNLRNLSEYAVALEAGLVAFAVGGAFVPFQYLEILWHFFALSVVIDRLCRAKAAEMAHSEFGARAARLTPTLQPQPMRSLLPTSERAGRP